MAGIFITYRRSDTIAWAGRLCDSLKKHFLNTTIFMDLETIPVGSKFSDYIRDSVGSCDILFVLIGPNWLSSSNIEGKSRLEDPDDFVTLEIKAALERDIPIVPILVGDALMPDRKVLPDDIKPICDYQNYIISDRSWHDDCSRLADQIGCLVGKQHVRSGNYKWLKATKLFVVVFVVILSVSYFVFTNSFF